MRQHSLMRAVFIGILMIAPLTAAQAVMDLTPFTPREPQSVSRRQAGRIVNLIRAVEADVRRFNLARVTFDLCPQLSSLNHAQLPQIQRRVGKLTAYLPDEDFLQTLPSRRQLRSMPAVKKLPYIDSLATAMWRQEQDRLARKDRSVRRACNRARRATRAAKRAFGGPETHVYVMGDIEAAEAQGLLIGDGI